VTYKARKKDGVYEVRSPSGVRAKRTTKKKAEKQIRLLNAIEHGYDPDEDRITRYKERNKM
jgi:hypothetical protein